MATLFKDVLILDGSRARAERVHMLVSKGRIAKLLLVPTKLSLVTEKWLCFRDS